MRLHMICFCLQARSENLFFDKIEAHISPNSPQIPDIQVKRFSVCGSVEVSLIPPGMSQVLLLINYLLSLDE